MEFNLRNVSNQDRAASQNLKEAIGMRERGLQVAEGIIFLDYLRVVEGRPRGFRLQIRHAIMPLHKRSGRPEHLRVVSPERSNARVV